MVSTQSRQPSRSGSLHGASIARGIVTGSMGDKGHDNLRCEETQEAMKSR